jgi:GNAT superfamily N-acetyltransferase
MRSAGMIRKLLVSERGKVLDHLLRLDLADRELRFFGAIGDDSIAAYSETIFAAGGIVLGCFVDGTLRAVGGLRPQRASRGSAAEVAITVEQPFQSRGIGTEMLRRLVELATNRSIKTLHLSCLLDNVPMQKIARKLGGALRHFDGTVEADIIQPWPSLRLLLGEALADGKALLRAWWGDPPSEP